MTIVTSMKRVPMPRVIAVRGRSAGHGSGMFTVHVTPDDFSLQSGPVEEQEQAQGDMNTMDLNSLQSPGILAGQYVPEDDVVATLDDGRTIQLAVKGTPIPLSVAYQRGLIDEKGNPVKQESKATGPSETKESPKKDAPKTPEGSAPSQAGK